MSKSLKRKSTEIIKISIILFQFQIRVCQFQTPPTIPMNEKVKNFDLKNTEDPIEEMHSIGMQSFTLVLPGTDGHVTIGWLLSNYKFRQNLTEGYFEESIKNINEVMKETIKPRTSILFTVCLRKKPKILVTSKL